MKKKSNKSTYNKAYQEILASLPEDLWLFLAKHNALKRYLNNCTALRVALQAEFRINNDLTMHSHINTAFRWSDTREGFDYWSNLFTLYLHERNNKNLSRVC